ncbi:MAG: prolipoprotein diacylglyceryl transferase [Candidatus Saccharicenans sp.]|nr:MAG: prolipoprotein diacylglyceryl transferase [Candidatus Aminicenantes bacterium]HEK84934.1 prolipoprotein diacylglyceryl transferase [Candidatus Aminicenantes bacterium]
MHPILLKIGPITVHTYGFFMALGVAAALWFIYVQAKKYGYDAQKLLDAAFWIIIVSLIGAKLILLVGHFSYYWENPGELLSLARSGGVFQGGLTFGLIFAIIYFKKKKIPFWATSDLVAPAIALGHGFGRLGCFSASCCYGRECSMPWAVVFKNPYAHELTGIPLNVPLHPVQLYESALNFLNFFVLFIILKKKKFSGQVFCFYIMNYSIIRFFTEFFRGDHGENTYLVKGPSAWTSLSLPQLYCLIGLVAGLVLYQFLKHRQID